MNAVIVDAKRTIFGKQNGLLNHFLPEDLAAPIISCLSRKLEDQINEVILGNATGRGGNLARLSVLQAGLPLSVPGMTIDRQCGSGLEAVRYACSLIQAGAGTMYIAGGSESSSQSPFSERARFSPDAIGDPDMGIAAEYTAARYSISRKKQDEYALLSHQRSRSAYDAGYYREEIVPLGDLKTDEAFVKKRRMEAIVSRAKPVFDTSSGTVTTANSSGISDGAAALLVMEEEKAAALGLKPVLRFIGSSVSGIHPNYPPAAPVDAIRNLLITHNLTPDDIDLYEINEAFAVKICVCSQELGIPFSKINVRGGALALGHPYGASGAALVTRLFYEAQRRADCQYAVAAIGSGGGIGLALLFEIMA
ncbi:acetyl-CoA C-acyltransferase [Bacillus inaquosorum]|uniref:acetyl-CoA C-acyltransferase n=1 Tax=Bacillus inaquosorum TaxID=483913 RepID=UPI003F176411